MNQIILVDKLKPSVSIGGLQVSIYNNSPHIESLSIEDKYINHFAMHIGINLFENNRESLNIIESYSNKLEDLVPEVETKADKIAIQLFSKLY